MTRSTGQQVNDISRIEPNLRFPLNFHVVPDTHPAVSTLQIESAPPALLAFDRSFSGNNGRNLTATGLYS